MKKIVSFGVPRRYAAPDCALSPILSELSILQASGSLEAIEEDDTIYYWG